MKYLLLIGLVVISLQSSAKKLPNVIVVVADDIGLGDVSYYRSQHTSNVIVKTPNIDQLAKTGMAFTDAHSPAALCAPSRYAIMTGKHCYRSPFPWGVWGAYEKSPINDDDLTLGKLMKQAGYATGFFGKWHLGGDFRRKDDSSKVYRGPRYKPELDVDIRQSVGGNPLHNGFDYSFTYPAGIQDVPYAVYENGQWMPLQKDSEISYVSQQKMDKIGVKLDKSEGLGDSNWDPHQMGPLLVDKAIGFIEKKATGHRPFFMYYCSQAVHLPHTPCDSLGGTAVKGSYANKHMDMIKELDVQIGMLIESLKHNQIHDNTIIIFTSDNGGLTFAETLKHGHQPSDIYRGGKNQIYEGGHRVPFIVNWPGVIKANSHCDEPVLALDIMATLAAITNSHIPAHKGIDSHNLLPLLKNEKQAVGHSYLLVQGGTGKEVAIINDGWKLIIQIDKRDKTDNTRMPIALFNLNESPSEQSVNNLIDNDEHEEKVKHLFNKYNQLRDKKAAMN